MASHTVLKEQLLEMGFEENLINGALKLLKENATLESVIELIDNGTAEEAIKNTTDEKKESSDDKQQEKTESNEDKQQQEKTIEEIEAKKREYAEKIKQRRMEIDEKEKEAERLKEIQRRKDGKDLGKVREELQRKQQENYIESLKREKDEEKAARDRILKQIELDKAERRARLQGNNDEKQSSAILKPSKPTIVSTASKTGKTKLAIRLLDGSQIVSEFDDKEILSAVRAFIVTQKNIDFNITFTMPLRPPFTEEDMTKSLFVLGLSPNARLQVIKR